MQENNCVTPTFQTPIPECRKIVLLPSFTRIPSDESPLWSACCEATKVSWSNFHVQFKALLAPENARVLLLLLSSSSLKSNSSYSSKSKSSADLEIWLINRDSQNRPISCFFKHRGYSIVEHPWTHSSCQIP